MSDRLDRISEEIKRTAGEIILKDLKDPRMPGMVSVTGAKVSKDLKYARIFVSVYGDSEDKKNAMSALKSAAGFVRKEIGARVKLRITPEVVFELDDSIEYGMRISKLIDENLNKDSGQ